MEDARQMNAGGVNIKVECETFVFTRSALIEHADVGIAARYAGKTCEAKN